MGKKMGDFKKAADEGLDKFFSEASELFEDVESDNKRKSDTSPQKKIAEKPNKAVKKVFSFRAEAETADNWRIWADAAGMKVDELGTKAITEYIKKHPLTADQNQIYELKKAQKKS